MAKVIPGEVVEGKYRIDEVLDSGPPTATCKATRLADSTPVTLKLLSSVLAGDREHRGRFQREAAVMGKIRHQAVPAVLEFHEDGNELFLAMEMCSGETLAARLQRTGGLPVEHVITYLDWLLDVLEMLHENQVVHRDFSPKNLAFAPGASGVEMLRVVDFRSARIGGDEGPKSQMLTQFGATLGTPEYQAPEQVAGGKIDGRTDLYQLGCVAYAMITGEPPFVGKAAHEVMLKQVKEEPQPPSTRRPDVEIPAGLESWILKMLKKPIDQRFPGAKTAREMLHRALRDGRLSSGPDAPPAAAPVAAPAAPAAAPAAAKTATPAAPRALTAERPAALRQGGSAQKQAAGGGVPWAIVIPVVAALVGAVVFLVIRR